MKKNLPTPKEYIADLRAAHAQVGDHSGANLKALKISVNTGHSPMPEALNMWLGRLSLLYGVPFEHMVPNADMLPKESLRFFYVDPNWISCLQDGATSIATHSSRDEAVIRSVYVQLQQSIRVAMQMVRPMLANAALPAEISTDLAVSGMLIRSQLISGWPGLEITAYEDYDIDANKKITGKNAISNLRIERLSPDVMLCLYPKMPKLVQFSEPKEGMAFGVSSDGSLQPRHLGYGGEDDHTGESFDPSNRINVIKRAGNKDVIDITGTKDALAAKLKILDALGKKSDVSPADFAIQLIKTAEQQSFLSDAGKPEFLNNQLQ